VTGYAQFHNQASEICDSKKMLRPGAFGFGFRLLTNELRSRANLAVIALNNAINEAIFTVNEEREQNNDQRQIRFINIDNIYEGNRFCEKTSVEKYGMVFLAVRIRHWHSKLPFRPRSGSRSYSNRSFGKHHH
jgi:NADH pyrophosphatase NudC (nudix superfamily)